jgi:hypothetical protein
LDGEALQLLLKPALVLHITAEMGNVGFMLQFCP